MRTRCLLTAADVHTPSAQLFVAADRSGIWRHVGIMCLLSCAGLSAGFAPSFAASAPRADTERHQSSTKPAKPVGPQSRGEHFETKFQFPVGSIVIVNSERRLYYITGKGEAVRYRVAVGKNEELWMGRTFVAAKIVEPKWIPINGDIPVEGGDPANPLGKRALYLDWSLLRIHGTPSRGSIGGAVSGGCIRMLNEDVMDLFERVHFGAPVYAIRSWKEPSLYQSVKVAEKIYHDPEAHEQAKEDLEVLLRERALDKREMDGDTRAFVGRQKLAKSRASETKPRQVAATMARTSNSKNTARSGTKFPGKLALGRSDD